MIFNKICTKPILMKNKILILISLVSFQAFINALLSYEVRGIERESQNVWQMHMCFYT